MVAPPTPERLEQDKKAIDDQFERAFALVEQLAKDTEALKASESERTARLDRALGELETAMTDLKSANRRREDDALRVRDDVMNFRDLLPKALEAQKQTTDSRLQEINTELKSLRTLISQRMNPNAATPSISNYLRPSTEERELLALQMQSRPMRPEPNGTAVDAKDRVSAVGRNPLLGSSLSGTKPSIPDWQRSMSTESRGSSTAANGTEAPDTEPQGESSA